MIGPVYGLDVTELDSAVAQTLVDRSTGSPAAELPDDVAAYQHAFAAYLHGYDVAVRDGNRWHWGSEAFDRAQVGHPRSGPAAGLERLRFFGPDGEVVVARIDGIWRAWQFRPTVVDTDPPRTNRCPAGPVQATGPAPDGPVRPRQRSYLIATDSTVRQVRTHFTILTHGSGQLAVVPWVLTGERGYAHTTEYFTTDAVTGAVRVAAVVWTGYGDNPHPVEEV
ncbi:hypothetical protein [Nocardia sp. NPDC058705]|uniref:hypothetical protein n=1 Tax=Nocardia sp. NPDC058705 TaxID=3346609 RepID=UPI00368A2E1A